MYRVLKQMCDYMVTQYVTKMDGPLDKWEINTSIIDIGTIVFFIKRKKNLLLTCHRKQKQFQVS